MSFSTSELQKLSILENLPKNLLSWLINFGTKVDLPIDAYMFKKDQPADFMFIIVSGKIQRYEKIGNQLVVADILSPGQVTGMLPYSRMTHYPGPALAKETSQILQIHKKDFGEMLALSEEFGQRLIAEMSNRVRGGVRMEQQLDKMASLGRLSAGLAHGVNNPAAAIHRTAKVIKEIFKKQNDYTYRLTQLNINAKDIVAIEDYIQLIKKTNKPKLSALQRNALEEQFEQFFESNSLRDFSNVSRICVESGLNLSELQNFSKRFTKETFNAVVELIAAYLEIDNMLSEIINASKEITELVSSIKYYSHMDQSSEYKPVDVCKSIDNTLKILDYKVKQKKIHLEKNYQENVQSIQGNAGQLNQVWTNIIDNAVDAVDIGGKITIKIKSTALGLEIRVIDNGAGIPEEIRDRIFDAFFTTKDIGQGTGLGLEISQRLIRAHGGQIKIWSKAGKTEAFIFLPFRID